MQFDFLLTGLFVECWYYCTVLFCSFSLVILHYPTQLSILDINNVSSGECDYYPSLSYPALHPGHPQQGQWCEALREALVGQVSGARTRRRYNGEVTEVTEMTACKNTAAI